MTIFNGKEASKFLTILHKHNSNQQLLYKIKTHLHIQNHLPVSHLHIHKQQKKFVINLLFYLDFLYKISHKLTFNRVMELNI